MKAFKSVLPVLVAVVLVAGSAVPAFAAGPPPFAGPRPAETIVEVAVAANTDPDSPYYEQLDTLIAAVIAADLDEALSGRRQFTVFAPTDAAFEALADELGLSPGGLVDLLLASPEYLEDVLLYHVAPGRRNSRAVLGSKQINTLYGGFIEQEGGVLTDQLGRDVGIVATDITASNGVIHVIDNVLVPYLP